MRSSAGLLIVAYNANTFVGEPGARIGDMGVDCQHARWIDRPAG
jgi:hypothetical protein